MSRCIVPTAEALLDKEIPALNYGFVRLVDYMGSDERIVQAARVSYGKGTKTVREDTGLIHYLMSHAHTSPFEQVVLTFHCKMPIFVARQWVRHRTARLNEVSGRYSVMKDEFYLPEPSEICHQDDKNRQGSADALPLDEAEEIIRLMEEDQKQAYARYLLYLDKGVSREIARVCLPLSLYTEWYWQMDLHNLFHFLWLRLDPHAQKQIRVFSDVLATCAKAVAPLAWGAFEEFKLFAVTFSRSEMRELLARLGGQPPVLSGRQLEEFEAKLARNLG